MCVFFFCFLWKNNRIIAAFQLELQSWNRYPTGVLYSEASRGAVAPPAEVKVTVALMCLFFLKPGTRPLGAVVALPLKSH